MTDVHCKGEKDLEFLGVPQINVCDRASPPLFDTHSCSLADIESMTWFFVVCNGTRLSGVQFGL